MNYKGQLGSEESSIYKIALQTTIGDSINKLKHER
jgi:hypothetical protein